MKRERFVIQDVRICFRKKAITVIFLLLISVSAFCSSVNFFTTGKPDMTLTAGFTTSFKNDLKTEPFIVNSSFSLDFNELYMDWGSALQNKKFDFTGNVFYMPTFFNLFKAGLGFGYHNYAYYDEFTENDLLFSVRFKWCKTDFYNVHFAFGFLLKNTEINAMKQYDNLFERSYFLELMFKWTFSSKFNLYCSVSSIDYFDYPLFGTPFFKGGVNYKINDNIGLEAAMTLKCVDMITSAVYLSECNLKTNVKVYF